MKKILSWVKSPSSDAVLFIILLVLLNLVAGRAFVRFDMTEPKSYSLSPASKQVVKTLEEPLGVKVFFSDKLPAPYSEVYQYVKDILAEYQLAANHNFSYEYFNMDKPENQSQARDYGLQQVQIREVKDNEVGYKNTYMGMAFTYADQIETLDAITTSDGLEYKITTMISKVISDTNVLSGMKDRVRLTLYKSAALDSFQISGLSETEAAVRSAYEKANKRFQNRLDFEFLQPSSEEAETLAERYGIQKVSWRSGGGYDYGAFGLVLETGDSFRVVPLEIVNILFGNTVQGLDGLEDSIVQSVQSLVSRTSVLAYVTNHGELAAEDVQNGAGAFASLVRSSYRFQGINLETDAIPAGVQSVIINGPKTAFSENELYKLDQFLLKGGNLMLFLDPFIVEEPEGQMSYYQMPQYTPSDTGLEKLLAKYGITANKEYVLDEQCFYQNTQQYGRVDFFYAPMMQKKQLAQKSPVTKNLGYVIFLQSGSLDLSEAEKADGRSVTVLASSSPASWTMKENILLSPLAMSAPSDKSSERAYTLAALVEGSFESAYSEPPAVSAPATDGGSEAPVMAAQSHIAKSTQAGKIFIAATSYITGSQILQENSTEPVALFLANAVDYLNGNGELCAMRTKGLSLNALVLTQGPLVNAVKYFNIIGLPLLVAAAGLFVLLARNKRRRAIRLRYDANDSREVSR